MDAKFEQNVIGPNAKGTQIAKMRDYLEGRSITVGLSADDTKEIVQAIDKLRGQEREEFERHLKAIREAKTKEEKKSLARRASEFIRDRGWGIFDSLVAGGILMLSRDPK